MTHIVLYSPRSELTGSDMLAAALLLSAFCLQGASLRVAIVGAGPVGLFLAVRLLALGPAAPLIEIDILEAGEDPRRVPSDRSFAIGISPRVYAAMASVPGLTELVNHRSTESITELVRVTGWASKRAGPAHMRVTTQVIASLCLSRRLTHSASTAAADVGAAGLDRCLSRPAHVTLPVALRKQMHPRGPVCRASGL